MGLCQGTLAVVDDAMPYILDFQQSDEEVIANGGLVYHYPFGRNIPIRELGYDSKFVYLFDSWMEVPPTVKR